jgi:hypothetical protein
MNTIMPTLEEARQLHDDVYFVHYGYWPVHEIDSTWLLRVQTEEILCYLVKDLLVDPNVITG